jgi:hypothetical protein
MQYCTTRYSKGSESMTLQDDPNRKRKQIYIHNELYKKVSIKAAEEEVDKGKVIEEALKKYFGGDERQG